MAAPLVQTRADGVWVRTRDQRARFDRAGMTLFPVFGPDSPREWPVAVTVASAFQGATPIPVTADQNPAESQQRVTIPRGGMREVHHLTLDGIEQTFEFDALPGSGDLVVHLDVDTDLTPLVRGERLSFHAGDLGYVELGEAFVLDGAGRRAPMHRTWTGGGIELRVPASFLVGATLPVTIDPIWTTFSSSFGVPDDAHPDIAFAGETQEYVVVWEEYTSQANTDIYGLKFDIDLASHGAALAIESGNDSWTSPSVAYSRADDEVLVAASVELGTNVARVEVQAVGVAAWQLNGAPQPMSSTGVTAKLDVDVAGSSAMFAGANRFVVSWSQRVGASISRVQYRFVGPNGVSSSLIRSVATQNNDVHPSLSTGMGDTSLFGDNWHLTWIRDDDLDGLGSVHLRRIHFSGDATQDSDNLQITITTKHARPTVSSLLDAPFQGSRPVVLAYETHEPDISRPTGLQSDIRGHIIAGDGTVSVLNFTLQEDAARPLLQRRPRLATDGEALFLSYLEEDPTQLNQGVFDGYLCTGELNRYFSSLRLSLAERHQQLTTNVASETAIELATRWQGDPQTTSVDGAAVWSSDENSGAYGQVEGAGIRYPFASQFIARAVGVQFGTANANSLGPDTTGWLRIVGDQISDRPHLVQATDLPPNSFGYLIVGDDIGNVNMPAGSQGRLLIGGSIGRFVGSIQSSGPGGAISTVVDPTNMPQPNGSVAAMAGDGWFFQLWHRDSVGGMPTSNFTNGALLYFVQ